MAMAPNERQLVNLFWTGGWDSTFRLLQLLLLERRFVQPCYVIDPDRLSTTFELRAMQNIKARVSSDWPEARNRLQPTEYVELREIADDDAISTAFSRIREKKYVGAQYEWLARLAKPHGDRSFEICTMRPEGGEVDGQLMKFEPDGQGYRLSQDLTDTDAFAVFRYFRYPVTHLSKRDMERLAVENGFRDVLELTWFCYRPRRNGTPCGCCRTCRGVVESKLRKRIPLTSQLRYFLSITPRLREFVLSHDRMYALGRRIKQLRQKPEHSVDTSARLGGTPKGTARD
jgi:hypothetical protein